jgi:hypothetical protein
MSFNNTCSNKQQIDGFEIICNYVAAINKQKSHDEQLSAVKEVLSSIDQKLLYTLLSTLIDRESIEDMVLKKLHTHLFKVCAPNTDTATCPSSTISDDADIWQALTRESEMPSRDRNSEATSTNSRSATSTNSMPATSHEVAKYKTYGNIQERCNNTSEFPALGSPKAQTKDQPKAKTINSWNKVAAKTREAKTSEAKPRVAQTRESFPEHLEKTNFSACVDMYDVATDNIKRPVKKCIGACPDIGFVPRPSGHSYTKNTNPNTKNIASEEGFFQLDFYPKSRIFYMQEYSYYKPGNLLPGWRRDNDDWQTSRVNAKSRHYYDMNDKHWKHQIRVDVNSEWKDATYPQYRRFMREGLWQYRINYARSSSNQY